MRVLFLATYFPKPTNTTMGVWALQEAQQLRNIGADVRVLSFTSWVPRGLSRFGNAAAWAQCPADHDWDGLKVEYPRWPFYQVGWLKKLWFHRPSWPLSWAWPFARRRLDRLLQHWRPDVVYAHHGSVNGYVAARFHERTAIPFVVKDHDFDEITSSETNRNRFQIYQKVCGQSAAMVPYSRRMKKQLLALFPGTTVAVNRFGIDPIPPKLFEVQRPAALLGKQVISSAGIFYPRKGFPLLVRAFNLIAPRHPNVVLRICGDGDERSEIERVIAESPARDRITLLGLMTHEKVLQELVWSDAFALVGWDEPFGVVFMEAMAAGKPIICANDGGINDVVENEVHGLTVPPHDIDATAAALDRILRDHELRSRCGQAAKALSETKLSSRSTAQQLFAILQAAAERRPIPEAD